MFVFFLRLGEIFSARCFFMRKEQRTKKLVYGAVLAALTVVLTYFIHFPIFPSAPFLEYDMGDVPLFFSSVLLGPWYGLLITAVACIVQGVTVSAQSGIIGIIMHFLATGSFVLCAGLITRKKKVQRIIPAFICGAVTQTLIMIPLNLIFTPAFGLETDVIKTVVTGIKTVLKCTVTFPSGIYGVLCGIAFAAAFTVAFGICMVYTVEGKDGKKAGKAKGAVLGAVAGLLYGSLVLTVMNILLGDIAFPESMAFVRTMLFTVIVPFNAIKAFANALITYILYITVGKRIEI